MSFIMSVTHRENQCQSHYFWATQHGFKARPGLVHVQGASRAPDVQCIFDPPSVPVCLMFKH